MVGNADNFNQPSALGSTEEAWSSSVELFDVNKNTWSSFPDFTSSKRTYPRLCVVQRRTNTQPGRNFETIAN